MKVLNIEDCKTGVKVKVSNFGNGVLDTFEGYIEDISSMQVVISQTNMIKTTDILEMFGYSSRIQYSRPSEVPNGERVQILLSNKTVIEGHFMGSFNGLPTSIMLKTYKHIPRTNSTIWQP